MSPRQAYECTCTFVDGLLKDLHPPTEPIQLQLCFDGTMAAFYLHWTQALGIANGMLSAGASLDEWVKDRVRSTPAKESERGVHFISVENDSAILCPKKEENGVKRSKRILLADGFGADFDNKGKVIAHILPPGNLKAHLVAFSPMELVEGMLEAGSTPDIETVRQAFHPVPGIPAPVLDSIRLEPSKPRTGRPRRSAEDIDRLRFEVIYLKLVKGVPIEKAKDEVATRNHMGKRNLEKLIGSIRSEIEGARVFDG